jgi:DNA (cytosine-5)-methyltransferase 1
MSAYYNEHDPGAAAWLRELIKTGVIAKGEVDERDIRDIRPSDLDGFTQCHFFAGIGVWSYALRLAGWPDTVPVWTGSCPCQPFSAAGKGTGFDDERHLWPAWFHLIEECRPECIFGEQVASPDGLKWFDLVRSDLEGTRYACGATDLCAAGVGAPHIRQRLWFVAHADGWNAKAKGLQRSRKQRQFAKDGRTPGGLALSSGERFEGQRLHLQPGQTRLDFSETGRGCEAGAVVDTSSEQAWVPRRARVDGITQGFWSDADWIPCVDEKWRPVESGTFPLAHGAPARMGRLRGYGNAIVSEAAATFIKAASDI